MFRRPRHNQEMRLQLARIPDFDEVGPLVVRGVRQFAVRHKYITGWYIMGLLVLGGLLISGGGRQLTKHEVTQYNRILSSIDVQAENDAADAYWYAYSRYQATRGWFWSCDSLCQRNKRAMQQAERRLQAVKAEGNKQMSDAKRIAGLTSDIAVNEMTDSFWEYLAAGKRFAKRQTAWDMMWLSVRSITRGRDESWAEFAAKILLQILINFSMGLVSALVFFVMGLWNILRSYQPNPVMAVLVFLAAASAASAFVATYIMGLFGAAAAGVYGMAKLAESAARQQIADQQRRERLNQRAHYD